MFFTSIENQEMYNNFMQCLKMENVKYKLITSSGSYKLANIYKVVMEEKSERKLKILRKYLKNFIFEKRVNHKFRQSYVPNIGYDDEPNYFNKDRIAIYTCIIGNYDDVAEPVWIPDNCDFYIVTNQIVNKESKWKYIGLEKFDKEIKNLSNIEINRYFKMHPEIIFPDYKYSIYLDGNIQPVTDLTEFINKIGKCGIAAHKHCFRNSVYEEAEVVAYLKRDKPERIKKHIEYLKSVGMPENYGLIECNILAREHHNPICKAVMKTWWEEFMAQSKRDQLSFMHALYLHGITVDEVGVLGSNVFANMAIRKKGHTKM